MRLPRGELVRKRVVEDLATPLELVLDRELTGYARLESQDALLLDADGVGVLTFDDGVPMAAYHTGTDTGGRDALSDIAVSGPYRVELYELEEAVLGDIHDSRELLVPPGMPAAQLAGDTSLIEATRDRADESRLEAERGTDSSLSAVESFLEDDDTIERLQNRAREQAQSRAEEWGFPTEQDPT